MPTDTKKSLTNTLDRAQEPSNPFYIHPNEYWILLVPCKIPDNLGLWDYNNSPSSGLQVNNSKRFKKIAC